MILDVMINDKVKNVYQFLLMKEGVIVMLLLYFEI